MKAWSLTSQLARRRRRQAHHRQRGQHVRHLEPTIKTGEEGCTALRHVESELWNAFYAVDVLFGRIRMHFERQPSGAFHEVDPDDGSTTLWAAGKAQQKLKTLMQRFDEAFNAARHAPTATLPADPILAALATMDTASDLLDEATEEEGFDPRTCPAFRAWEDAAVKFGNTTPTTKAGLVVLLERLAVDIERGPAIWHRDAADSAAAAANALLEGGAA